MSRLSHIMNQKVLVFIAFLILSVTFEYRLYSHFSTYLTWAVALGLSGTLAILNLRIRRFKADLPPQLKVLFLLFTLLATTATITQIINSKSLIVAAIYSSKFFTLGASTLLIYLSGINFDALRKATVLHALIYLAYLLLSIAIPDRIINLLFDAGDGRYGTHLAYPGTLCYVGLWFFIFGLSEFLIKSGKLYYFLGALGLTLIGFDGSRSTFFTMVFLTSIALMLTDLKWNDRIKKGLLTLGMILLFSFLVPKSLSDKTPSLLRRSLNGIYVMVKTISPSSNLPFSHESDQNNVLRTEMILNGTKGIRVSFFGAGIGSSDLIYNKERSALHNIYYQVVAEYGIIGFTILIGIFASITTFSYRPFKERNQVFLLGTLASLVFPVAFFFHPISNEISTWLYLFFTTIICIKQNNIKPNYE